MKLEYFSGSQFAAFVRQPDSDVLIVAFSHVGYPEGKFAFTNAFANLHCNKLFLNCPGNSWYQNGIPGFGDSVEAAAMQLKLHIAELGVRRTIFVGMSMGGYGALLFGLLVGADIILAFTAEVQIGSERGRSFVENRIRFFDPVYQNLSYLINENTKSQLFLIYGEGDLLDLSLLWPISSKIVERKRLQFFMVEGGHQCTLNLNVPLIVGCLIKEGWIGPGNISDKLVRNYSFNHLEFELYRVIEVLSAQKEGLRILSLVSKHPALVSSRHNLAKIRDSLSCGI